MLEDERVQKISFTGSPAVGKEIKNKAGLKRITLEFGSNSALYVDHSVKEKLDDIVENQLVGHLPTMAKYASIHSEFMFMKKIADEFLKKFVEKTEKIHLEIRWMKSTVVTV